MQARICDLCHKPIDAEEQPAHAEIPCKYEGKPVWFMAVLRLNENGEARDSCAECVRKAFKKAK